MASKTRYLRNGRRDGRRGRIRKRLLDDLKNEERGSSRSHSVKNLLGKRLWTSRRRDYAMNAKGLEWCNLKYYTAKRIQVLPE
jgi:hypothetical protein